RRQEQREKRHRDLIERVKPAAEKYQQELAAKKADHADTLAARQALAVTLRGQRRYGAAAYHVSAVLDAGSACSAPTTSTPWCAAWNPERPDRARGSTARPSRGSWTPMPA